MKISKLKLNNCRNGLPAQTGYAILELIFYISFFAVLSLVVINAMIIMSQSFRETMRQSEWIQSGAIMERMVREVRQASAVSGISAGNLRLDTKDEAGAAKTVEFLLSGSDVQLIENGVMTGNLNAPNIIITDLAFTQITTAKGSAVRIILTVRSQNDQFSRLHSFYDTVGLRGNY